MFRWKRFTFLPSLRQGILEKKSFLYYSTNEGTEVFRGSFSTSKMWKMSRPLKERIPPAYCWCLSSSTFIDKKKYIFLDVKDSSPRDKSSPHPRYTEQTSGAETEINISEDLSPSSSKHRHKSPNGESAKQTSRTEIVNKRSKDRSPSSSRHRHKSTNRGSAKQTSRTEIANKRSKDRSISSSDRTKSLRHRHDKPSSRKENKNKRSKKCRHRHRSISKENRELTNQQNHPPTTEYYSQSKPSSSNQNSSPSSSERFYASDRRHESNVRRNLSNHDNNPSRAEHRDRTSSRDRSSRRSSSRRSPKRHRERSGDSRRSHKDSKTSERRRGLPDRYSSPSIVVIALYKNFQVLLHHHYLLPMIRSIRGIMFYLCFATDGFFQKSDFKSGQNRPPFDRELLYNEHFVSYENMLKLVSY